MKGFKKALLILSVFSLISSGLFTSCFLFSGNKGNEEETESGNNTNYKIDPFYWGTWTRMDNGEKIKINSEKVLNTWGDEISNGLGDIKKESQNVIVMGNESTSPRLFRSAGYARSFKATVAGINKKRAADDFDTVDSVLSNIEVKRENRENKDDSEKIKSDEQGMIEFTDAVADEEQNMTVVLENETIELSMEPHFDGEDMGVIPVVTDGCNFKVTYRENNISYDYNGYRIEDFYYYANKDYSISLDIMNIGDEEMADGYYEISCDDPNLVINSSKKAVLNTFEAKSFKTVQLQVKYNTIYSEYIDVPVNISIKDYKSKREWLDRITLRFYRRPVYITVNAYSTVNSGNLHGFVIAPDGRSQYFDVSSNGQRMISVPWTSGSSIYKLVINGADAYNEMFYAFKVSDDQSTNYNYNNIYDWQSFIKKEDIDEQMTIKYSYEGSGNNNTEDTAANVGNGFTLVRSYIQKGDIDYFILDINETTTTISAEIDQYSDISLKKVDNGNEFTITAPKDYANYTWELNGKIIQDSEERTLTINKTDLASGIYTVYLKVYKLDSSNIPYDYRSAYMTLKVTK